MTVATELLTDTMVSSSLYLGFLQFCNQRAVLERPNSSFLDLPLRYAGSDAKQRLAILKKTEALSHLTFEGLMRVGGLILLFALLSFGLWLSIRNRWVVFPAFERK